jgi:hypothetical protein
LDPSQVPYEVPNGPDCATSCNNDAQCVQALGPRHFCVQDKCSDLPARPEFLGADDECVLWTVRIPGNDSNASPSNQTESSPRGMALDKEGYVWVGDDMGSRNHIWKIKPVPPSTEHPRGFGVIVCPKQGGCCPDGQDCSAGALPTPLNQPCPQTARDAQDRATLRDNPATQCVGNKLCIWTVDDSCRIDVTVAPYGAVIDSGETHPDGFGYLWITQTSGYLQRIDTKTGAVSKRFRATDGNTWGSGYGITIDHEDRPWIVSSESFRDRPTLFRFNATKRNDTGDLVSNFDAGQSTQPDPSQAAQTSLWSMFRAALPPYADGRDDPFDDISTWRGRGVTTELVAPATPGGKVTARIWATFNNDWSGDNNWIIALDADTGVEDTTLRTDASPNTDCRDPIGIGMGFDQKVWVVAQNSDTTCAFDPDPQNLLPTGGMRQIASATTGRKPYTYSDFTGNLFRSFTNPEGRYRILVQACPDGKSLEQWSALRWRADVPGTSKLEVRLRFGATQYEAMDVTKPQIIAQTLIGPTPPPSAFSYTPLSTEKRNYCEVEFRLLADRDGLAPILYALDAARTCIDSGS